MNSTKNLVGLHDIVIIYFGNINSSFKFFGQVNLQSEQKIEVMTTLEEESYNFLIKNGIKDIHIRVVFPYFQQEATLFNAIENFGSSVLSEMILDPLKISETSLIPVDSEVFHPIFTHEQKTVFLQTHSMCLNKNQPNIKLIEGPPGSGKSVLIENLIAELLNNQLNLERKPKILLCAKNNSAVDMILYNLKRASKASNIFNVVRYGVDKHVHSRVQNYSINNLIMREWRIKLKSQFDKERVRIKMKTS